MHVARQVEHGELAEREQKTHASKDGNPLIDGRGAVRLMRGSIGRG
jgi:hypothetical protein